MPESLPPVGERGIFYWPSFFPPPHIEGSWVYVMGAPQWAEELDRAAWLEDVKQRLGLITLDDDEEARAARIQLAREDPVWPDLRFGDWAKWRRVKRVALDDGHELS